MSRSKSSKLVLSGLVYTSFSYFHQHDTKTGQIPVGLVLGDVVLKDLNQWINVPTDGASVGDREMGSGVGNAVGNAVG